MQTRIGYEKDAFAGFNNSADEIELQRKIGQPKQHVAYVLGSSFKFLRFANMLRFVVRFVLLDIRWGGKDTGQMQSVCGRNWNSPIKQLNKSQST